MSSSSSLTGLTSAGYLPASLAALLNRPLDHAAMTAPPIGTVSVGSLFSYPPSATSTDPSSAATTALQIATFTHPSSSAMMVPQIVGSSPPVVAPVTAMPHNGCVWLDPAAISLWQPHHHQALAGQLYFLACAGPPLLRSHYLMGYVDGSLPCPPALVDGVHGPVINPAHRVWTGQDQANLSSIQGYLTPGVAGLVVFAKTSHEAWSILERTFSAQSQARANALHRQLSECEKLDLSVTDYYNKVRELVDTLASIGQPLRDSEFTSYFINGLDEEYDDLVEVVNERAATSPMPAHELYQRLLNTKQRVEARPGRRGHGDSSALTANKGGFRTTTANGSGKLYAPKQPAPSAPDHSGGGRPTRVCQLYGRDGHLASKCHRRFQPSFLDIGNSDKVHTANGAEILVRKYSRNWTKSMPRSYFYTKLPKTEGERKWGHEVADNSARPSPGRAARGPALASPDLPFRLQIAFVAKPPYREPRYGKHYREAAAANPISGDLGDRLRTWRGESSPEGLYIIMTASD
ncbi:hypothetical protein QYE76_068440 [Lolium multiflorum]|uniref:Uncharacterized protein n=1 Tax=Lolium multiflorum TaxID=4521 RepID=A0AAD8SEH9_LOLMU|nr:hypothetical protein QYE76_068440 [Lolium multiflorum]